jgi:hypothetical protein
LDRRRIGGRWVAAAYEAELAAVRDAPEGTRNDALNRAAFRLGRIVSGIDLDENAVHAALIDAGIAAGLSHAEAERTTSSGFTAGRWVHAGLSQARPH